MLEWIKRRVILASPYCWLWEDSYQGKAYCKRLILWRSIVITGKMIHEAKAYQRAHAGKGWRWPAIYKLRKEYITLRVPYWVLA